MLVHTVRWLCWQSSIMVMKQDMAHKNFYWEQEPSITASFAHLKLQPAHLPLVVFLGELPSGACHGYGLLQTVWPFLSAAALHQYSGNWNLWWSIPFSRPLLPALCTFTGGCRPVVILRTCSSFTSLTSAPTWHELQWLRQAVTLPCLDGPALSHPNPACSAPCATLALRWSLTASLGEGMICSDSAWNNTEYMRRVVGFFGRVQQERKIKCRRNKNTTFEISPPKKNQVKKTPCLQSLLVFFRQEREGCSEDTFLKCSQRRLSGEGWGEGGGKEHQSSHLQSLLQPSITRITQYLQLAGSHFPDNCIQMLEKTSTLQKVEWCLTLLWSTQQAAAGCPAPQSWLIFCPEFISVSRFLAGRGA